jgi:hypothetical protein
MVVLDMHSVVVREVEVVVIAIMVLTRLHMEVLEGQAMTPAVAEEQATRAALEVNQARPVPAAF